MKYLRIFSTLAMATSRSKSLVLILICTFCVFYQASATVDYLAVNKITKEIYSFDQEQVAGIFWVSVGDGAAGHYLDLGYTYTKNPYLLDDLLTWVLLGVSFVALLILWRKNLIRRSPLNILFYLHLMFALKYLALYSYKGVFGVPVTVILFVIPIVILLINRMIERFKVRRLSMMMQIVFTVMFSYLLYVQMLMPAS